MLISIFLFIGLVALIWFNRKKPSHHNEYLQIVEQQRLDRLAENGLIENNDLSDPRL